MSGSRIRATKKCMTCKKELPWTHFSIVWGPTQAASFLRRTCRDCEPSVPPALEARPIERELRRLQSHRLRLVERLAALDERIEERLQQLETAKRGGAPAPPSHDEP